MKKFLLGILAGIIFLSTSVFAEKEYQFDIIFEPDYYINMYSFDGQNVIAEEYKRDFDKVTVYNQRMEKIDEFDKAHETTTQQDNDNDETEILQRQMKEKYGYECMSEFKNGFSFVREQSIGLPLNFSTSKVHTLHYESYEGMVTKERVNSIAEECRMGYKFIDEDGNVIFVNLEADLSTTVVTSRVQPDPYPYGSVSFRPSYFTDYGMAVVKRDDKFGLINTSGEILLDFTYDKITIFDKNTAIVKKEGRERFYYISSQTESDFSASSISYLTNNLFQFNETGEGAGVVNLNGDIMIPLGGHRGFNVFVGHESNRTIAFYEPGDNSNRTSKYYDKNAEVVCYSDGFGGAYDKSGKLVWDSFTLNGIGGNFNNIYTIQKTMPGSIIRALAAINEIPKPVCDTGDRYISIMFDNPLVNVGGRTRTIEEKNYFYTPVIRDDRILLPYELLGALDIWARLDGESQTITVSKEGKIIILNVGRNEADLDGEIVHLDVPAQIIDGRVLVPYEAVAVALGADGDWDGANNTLTLFFE